MNAEVLRIARQGDGDVVRRGVGPEASRVSYLAAGGQPGTESILLLHGGAALGRGCPSSRGWLGRCESLRSTCRVTANPHRSGNLLLRGMPTPLIGSSRLLSILRPSAAWIDKRHYPASDPALRLGPNNYPVTYPDLGRIARRPSSSPRPSSQAASGPSSLWLGGARVRWPRAASPSRWLHRAHR
jgi:hypothetical protein